MPAVTKKDILVAARGLIENKGWTQYAYARCGPRAVPVADTRATCFCTLGAVHRAELAHGTALSGADATLHLVVRDRGYSGVPRFNDDPMTTKADVLSLFDWAIELAQAGEAAVSQEGA